MSSFHQLEGVLCDLAVVSELMTSEIDNLTDDVDTNRLIFLNRLFRQYAADAKTIYYKAFDERRAKSGLPAEHEYREAA